jgi:hypothetical protein
VPALLVTELTHLPKPAMLAQLVVSLAPLVPLSVLLVTAHSHSTIVLVSQLALLTLLNKASAQLLNALPALLAVKTALVHLLAQPAKPDTRSYGAITQLSLTLPYKPHSMLLVSLLLLLALTVPTPPTELV